MNTYNTALLALLLCSSAMSTECDFLKSVTAEQTTKGNKLMSETVTASRQKLQYAQQVLDKTKVNIKKAEDKHLTSEEIIDAYKNIRGADTLLKSIPSSDVTTSSTGIADTYNKLISDLTESISEIHSLIYLKQCETAKELVTETAERERGFNSALKRLDNLRDKDTNPALIKLRDDITHTLDTIKQVSDAETEQKIESAEKAVKDIPRYIKESEEGMEANDFDKTEQGRIGIWSSATRAEIKLEKAFRRLLELQGNVSDLTLKNKDKLANLGEVIPVLNQAWVLTQELEEEYINTLTEDERRAKHRELVDTVNQDIQKARKFHEVGDKENARILYENAGFKLVRASIYTAGLTRDEYSSKADVLRDESDNYFPKGHPELIAEEIENYYGLNERFEKIEDELTDAELLERDVKYKLAHFEKYQTSEQEQRQIDGDELASLKNESGTVKVSSDGTISSYKEGDILAEGDQIGYTYTSIAQLPSTDTGEAFNGLSGRNRRVLSSSIRVLNAQNVEVGTSFDKMLPVKELKDEAKSGEFDCPISGNFTSQDGLCICQNGANTGVITGVITRFSTGG